MYVKKNFGFKAVMLFSGWYIFFIILWTSVILLLYKFFTLKFLDIPWISVAIIGTAVSFYIGFKNNQAYDRIWEARKIWGAMLNSSRMFATTLKGYLRVGVIDEKFSEIEINNIIKKLIYRHIAYVYVLRDQLLIPAPWEHVSLNSYVARASKNNMNNFGVGILEDNLTKEILEKHLDNTEYEELKQFSNMATHLIDLQSKDLLELRKNGVISDLYHIDLQRLLNNFYAEQGKAERIKKFPFPRAYAHASMVFVFIFILLLPLGLIGEFADSGVYGLWLFVPVTSLVAWIFLMIELIGDYSENPFEGLGNDIPMFSICRSIEIDLKEMIQDENIPKSAQAQNGVLM